MPLGTPDNCIAVSRPPLFGFAWQEAAAARHLERPIAGL